MHHQPESFSSQYEKTSGLAEWLLWLVISLLIFGALTIGMILKNQEIIEYGMYIVIGGLAVGLIIKGYLDARFIEKEKLLASKQVRILEQVDDFETFLKLAPSSIFRSHIDNLYTISLSQHDVNQDNLIEILHSRLLAKNKVVELFASILITLGLIGTIVGLIIMMDGLSAIIHSQQANNENLLLSLVKPGEGPLAGLGVAFYTTLLGAVLGGVVLRILTNVIDSNIMQYTAHLAELTEVHVLPAMRRMAKERQKEVV
jgi:hypothetical protein